MDSDADSALTKYDTKVEEVGPALHKGPEPVGDEIEKQLHHEDLRRSPNDHPQAMAAALCFKFGASTMQN